MSGIIDDVTSAFSSVGDAIGSVFSGGSDAASAASDAASGAADAASTASDAASTAGQTFNIASDAASNLASNGTAISDAAGYLDNTAAASYTAGVATGSWGNLDTGFNFAADASGNLAPGSSYLGSTVYDTIDNGEFNANEFGGLDPNAPAYTNMAVATANYGPAAAQANAGTSWWSKTKSFVGGMFGGGGGGSSTSGGGMSDLSKLMLGQMVGGLVTGGIQAAGAYLASKPHPPANFSGRTPGGGGGGLGMHTTGNGFGLAAGGTQNPPSGVPSQLAPNPQAEALGGSSGGIAPVAPPNGAPNIQQTVANQAGVGGLIPQGSVNYMKGNGNG